MILAALVLAVAAGAPVKAPVAEVYKAHCQVCHMVDGNSPLPQMNFADGEWKHTPTPAKLAAVIADGVPGTAMLPFKAKLTPAEIRALAAYVRTFDPKLGPRPKKK
jgi:mono/diheme cytochrome c family protein